jgi:hypothetical protein
LEGALHLTKLRQAERAIEIAGCQCIGNLRSLTHHVRIACSHEGIGDATGMLKHLLQADASGLRHVLHIRWQLRRRGPGAPRRTSGATRNRPSTALTSRAGNFLASIRYALQDPMFLGQSRNNLFRRAITILLVEGFAVACET